MKPSEITKWLAFVSALIALAAAIVCVAALLTEHYVIAIVMALLVIWEIFRCTLWLRKK